MRLPLRPSRLIHVLAPIVALSLASALAPPLPAQDTARDDFNFAAGLHDKGLHDRAVKAFQDFLKKWSGDGRVPKARFYLGQSLAELHQDAEALPCFLAYLETGDEALRSEAALRAGELLHRAGRAKDAVPHLRAVARSKAAPELVAAARHFLGEALVATGDADGGRKAWTELLEAAPKDRYAPFARSALGFLELKAGRAEPALEHFRAAAAAGAPPELASECRVMAGECLARLGRHDDAAAAFQDAIAKGAGAFEPQALAGLAPAHAAAGRAKEAVAAARTAASKHAADPRTAPGLIRTAAALHGHGKTREGLDVLGLVKDAKGQDAADLAYWRGILLAKSGDAAGSLDALRKAVADAPTAHRRFSLAQALSDAGKHEEAVPLFTQVRKEATDETLALEAGFGEAFSLNQTGKPAAAVPLLERIASHAKAPADLRLDAAFALAENLYALKEHAKARDAYGRVLEAGGAHVPEALYKRGWCAYLLKRWDDALRDFQALLEQHPKSPFEAEVKYLAGKCHEGAGRHAEARAAFEAAGRDGGDAKARARARLGAAAAALQAGDRIGALASARKAAQDADDPAVRAEALVIAGDILLADGKADEAADAYARALDQGGTGGAKAAGAGLGLAWARRAQGRQDDAAAAAAAVAAAAGDAKDAATLGEALHLQALAESGAGRPERAAAVLADFDRRCPGHARAAEARLLLGVSLAKAGKAAEAEPVLAGLAGRPEKTEVRAAALYEWGFCLDALKKPAERDRAFARLAQEHPDSNLAPDALFRLGESAYEAKRFGDAAGLYTLLAERPDAGDLLEKAVYKAGWCLRQSKKPAEAAVRFLAVAGHTESPLAAEAAYLAGEELEAVPEWQAAGDAFRLCAKQWPASKLAGDAELRAVLCQKELGDLDGVLRAAPAALERHGAEPRALRVRSALADALFEKKLWGRARSAYRLVVAGSEGEFGARAQHRLGLCHAEEGDDEKALDELLKVTILYAHEEWVAKSGVLAAELFLKRGEKDKARKLLQDVVKNQPRREEAKAAARKLAELDQGDNHR